MSFLRNDIVVDARLAIFVAVHPLSRERRKEPLKHFEPVNSERIPSIFARYRMMMRSCVGQEFPLVNYKRLSLPMS